MDRPIKCFIRVGTILHVTYKELGGGEGPILEKVKKLATDNYFDVIEVGQMKDKKVFEEVGKIIKNAKMDISYGGQGRLLSKGLNINSLDDIERQKAIETLKEGIDEAYEIGAEDFAFLAGQYENDKKEIYFERLLDSTRELCIYAKTKGNMPILCEVFDYDIAKKSLIGPVHMVKRYVETICDEFDNFGLMVDLSHIPMLHETLEENILPIRKYIRHAHIGNTVIKSPECEAYGDEHPPFGFPNSENDVLEVANFLKLLLEIGFLNEQNRPIVSFEVKPYGDNDPDICLANAKRTLDLAWQLV